MIQRIIIYPKETVRRVNLPYTSWMDPPKVKRITMLHPEDFSYLGWDGGGGIKYEAYGTEKGQQRRLVEAALDVFGATEIKTEGRYDFRLLNRNGSLTDSVDFEGVHFVFTLDARDRAIARDPKLSIEDYWVPMAIKPREIRNYGLISCDKRSEGHSGRVLKKHGRNQIRNIDKIVEGCSKIAKVGESDVVYVNNITSHPFSTRMTCDFYRRTPFTKGGNVGGGDGK